LITFPKTVYELIGLKVEMVVKTRDFTALKTEACGLTQAAYLHFSNTTKIPMARGHR
jgi:hypothetical protein